MFGNVFKAFTHRQSMDSDSSSQVETDELRNRGMVLIDHVPEALMKEDYHHHHNPDEEDFYGDDSPTKDENATPETESLLTETDDSLLSSSIGSPQLTRTSTSVKSSTTPSSTTTTSCRILPWCGTKYYSDLIQDGVAALWLSPEEDARSKEVIMVYESPATAMALAETSFFNDFLFPFHDYPLSSLEGKTVVGPLRYSCMTGNRHPVYLQHEPPTGLVDHWTKIFAVNPNDTNDWVPPTFCHEISDSATICAYLPLESLVRQHLVNPYVHYQLAGKDAIVQMTAQTTRLLPDTVAVRPCVVKVTHAMGSRGIFIIRNDEDQAECFQVLEETGSPNYVVTDFVQIVRNLAAHFFIHPATGDVTWFGSSENLRDEDTGDWSSDATLRCQREQDELRELMAPYVQEVAQYCLSQGYWGACGIDILIDDTGRGYVVDVNPRVTGSCPALMALTKLQQQDPSVASTLVGTFRRSTDHAYPGPATVLLQQVEEFNASQETDMRVIVFSFCERANDFTEVNIGVYGTCQSKCVEILNQFAPRRNHP